MLCFLWYVIFCYVMLYHGLESFKIQILRDNEHEDDTYPVPGFFSSQGEWYRNFVEFIVVGLVFLKKCCNSYRGFIQQI